MVEFVREAGWAIWPVFVFGGVSLLVAAFHAWRPRRERLALVIGSSIGTLLIACLGTVVGLQKSVEHIGKVAAESRWIFLLGLHEALNNLVAAFLIVAVTTCLATAGSYRRLRVRTSSPPSSVPSH
jgi:formate hydrogenlyase subunit 3/multisubunit Na+/H+ antiporter MnhD subunit